MLESSLAKAAVSAVFVGALLTTLRRATPRTAGLAAAVPINSMPALFWLWVDQGSTYATTAALGSFWGTGLTALLGVVFATLAARCRPTVAAAIACAGVGALAATAWTLPAVLTVVTVFAMVAVLAGRGGPSLPADGSRRRSGRGTDALLSMGVAGLMSLVTSELARRGGPQLCGVIATLPVIGLTTMHAGHRLGGTPRMMGVLDGYLAGMLAKAAFLGAMFLAWRAGLDGWAWAAACACAGGALEAQRRLPDWRDGVAPGGLERS